MTMYTRDTAAVLLVAQEKRKSRYLKDGRRII
jgi:hypothetical protein